MKLALGRFYNKNCDIRYNFEKILKLYKEAVNRNIEIVIFPRLAITGFFLDDILYNNEFIKKIEKYLEKIITATVSEKTKILLGSPFLENDTFGNENDYIEYKKLKDSVLFIDNGYIDSAIYRKEISKNNKLEDYKYFDKNSFLKYFFYNKKKFSVLLSDDIYNNFNIILINDNKPDYIICLDSSDNTKEIEKHLIKLSKFSKSPVIYMNNTTYHEGMLFDGKIIMINENYELIINDNYKNDCLFEFEIDCDDGSELFVDKTYYKNNNDIYYVLKKYFQRSKITLDIDKYQNLLNNKNYNFIKFSDSNSKCNCKIVNLEDYINIELYNKLNKKEKNIIKNKIIEIL